jgi:hypothetical protein
MRILITNMLALAVLLFGATSASAWSFDSIIRNTGNDTISSLTSTSFFTVDVFFTADQTGLQNFSVGVVYDQGGLTYDAVTSAALPIIYPSPAAIYGTTGAQPGYIMYNAGKPAQVLYPTQTPAHALWNGANQPGKFQVNLDFADPGLAQNLSTGSNIWIGSMVFHVEPGYAGGTIDLSLDIAQGNLIFANNDPNAGASATLGGPLTIVTHVPEPTTAALIGLGVLGLAIAGRRK